jgi:uncharacterized OB-fold protein
MAIMEDRKMPPNCTNPESDPFYAAAEEGKFMIRRCTSCKKAHWYPRAVCPFCFGETEWEQASGEGTIYSFSTMLRSNFTMAYVTLKEGPTMMTNIVKADPDQLKIGGKVKLTWVQTDANKVPCFEPA